MSLAAFASIRQANSPLRSLELLPRRIAVTYAVGGFLWILVSDLLLDHALGAGISATVMAQIAKGWSFIAVTSVLLYGLAVYLTRRASRATQEMITAFRARDQLAAIVDAAPDPVATADIDGRILSLNPAGRHMAGLGRDQSADGMWLSDLHPSESADYLRTVAIPEALRSGQWSGEIRVKGPDGSVRPALQTVISHRHCGGRTAWFSVIIRDLSEQRRAQDRIRMLEKVEALGHLTGSIAHDFNNLLVIVLGNAEALKTLVRGDSRAERLADMILRAAERGTDLTGRLLAFSRQKPLEPHRSDLNALIAASMPLIEQILPAAIKARFDPADGLEPIAVDRSEFETCLLNLAINARDAMPTGGRLTIATQIAHLEERDIPGRVGARPGRHLVVAVRDTGTGMSSAVACQIFEPYFTTKAEGRGTGLGLPMVLGFVTRSGGHLTVDTAEGKGTEIRIHLPLDRALTPPDGGG